MEPVAYNDSLAVQQIRIAEKANQLQDAFAGFVMAEMEIRRNDLENQLDKAETTVNSLGGFNKDETLFKASKQLIQGYQELNSVEYEEVIKILSKPDSVYSDVDEARLTILFKTIDEKSNRLITDFLSAQREFAGKNNLDLKPAQEQAQAE
jgi:aspartyl/asparaginyl-tRNA synthetase